ncbi:MAG: coproporphyrinogen III oxidase [Mariprofundaceae bacterium]|nr:coproporphyrinogen III oxidase [Mariprofundaceae bacterium]
MHRIPAQSKQAEQAYELASRLQQRFVQGLEKISKDLTCRQAFEAVEWFRDEGLHGGGIRYTTADGDLFGRGSVNVSQVHYDENPEKKLGSATALSTIIHPCSPHAPSVHIHISWTATKGGEGYWRMMADLNPAIENPASTQQFMNAMRAAAGEDYEEGMAQGDRYFYIPVLKRHRGAAHFYLEQYNSGNAAKDRALAASIGDVAIDVYLDILATTLQKNIVVSEADKATQLTYHSLYFLQVLTLDRGTTTGLMVHDQNDIGILASLPAYINRDLLLSWVEKMPEPQGQLLAALISALPTTPLCLINNSVKQALADISRQHYCKHPEALAMQASGNVTPTTVKNHHE